MSTPLVLRIVASSYNIAKKTGEIIRNVLKAGDLGIVDKSGQKVGIVSLYVYHIILPKTCLKCSAVSALQTSVDRQSMHMALGNHKMLWVCGMAVQTVSCHEYKMYHSTKFLRLPLPSLIEKAA